MTTVRVERCKTYDPNELRSAFAPFDPLFRDNVHPGDIVALKPNWIAPHHKHNPNEWQSVITHPNFITEVLTRVVSRLGGDGKVIIADGPQTDQSFEKLQTRMNIPEWTRICEQGGVALEIIDLRDHEWEVRNDVLINRKDLPGDPLGSVEYGLGSASEFNGHQPSTRGYYGADYDISETTLAHTNGHNRYRISGSMVNVDVFINLPKLKTHKKAGITCSLKNLVGINTYRNFLPHHTEGTPCMGGDQFPDSGLANSAEVKLLRVFKAILLQIPFLGRAAVPVKRVGKWVFGETTETVRNGAWYGNDTLWRTILDLNKTLLYGNPDSTMREGSLANKKRYLSFVDAIIAGEGNGPECPDPIDAQLIVGGDNPVAIDCTCAGLMGFDYQRIPALKHAFEIVHYKLIDDDYENIVLKSDSLTELEDKLEDLSDQHCPRFRPHFGWAHSIEQMPAAEVASQ